MGTDLCETTDRKLDEEKKAIIKPFQLSKTRKPGYIVHISAGVVLSATGLFFCILEGHQEKKSWSLASEIMGRILRNKKFLNAGGLGVGGLPC